MPIAAAKRAGFVDVRILTVLPAERVVTRTLGEIERGRIACEVPLQRADTWNESATWGGLARAGR